MTKEQILLFDAKLEKLSKHHDDMMYFEGFKECIQFMMNVVFKVAERSAYDMKDDVMRYSYTRLLFNMKMALEEKLVDELFRRMDQAIEVYKEHLDDYLIDTDIPDPEWMDCDDDCKHCTVAECTHRTDECTDPGSFLPDSGIDFMNIGGKKE